MKKLALSIAIVLGMSLGAFAQGGLFQYGNAYDDYGTRTGLRAPLTDPLIPIVPGHGFDGSQDGTETPLAGGALLLIGFGAAYALKKRSKK